MKTLLTLFTVATVLCATPAIVNAEAGHDHERAGGPKGGRLLDDTEPRAEFFVEKDNTVTITFYDDALKPVAVTEQAVTVIADAEGNKSTLEFEKKGDVLVSKGALPEGEGLNLVVQFKQTAEAKPMNFRFVLEKGMCGMCKRAEYACICEH
jgi:hypothetical protein